MKTSKFVVFLYMLISYSFVSAQECNIDGSVVLLTANVTDDVTPGYIVSEHALYNVKAVDVSGSIYFDAVIQPSGDILRITVKDEFTNFEQNEMMDGPLFTWEIILTCTTNTQQTVPVQTQIVDTNNNEPKVMQDGPFDYTLPSPFPLGISLTDNYKSICATDYDITDANNDITFSLDPSETRFSINTTQGSDYKTNCAQLTTNKWLESTDEIKLTINAQDNGHSTPISVTITFNQDTSLPREPKFVQDYYSGSVDSVEAVPDTQIILEQGDGTITVSEPGTLKYGFGLKTTNDPAWVSTFDVQSVGDFSAKVVLTSELTEDDLIRAENTPVIIIVEAYPENYKDKSSTVAVFIRLPNPTTTTTTVTTTTPQTTITTTSTTTITTTPKTTETSLTTILSTSETTKTPTDSPGTSSSDGSSTSPVSTTTPPPPQRVKFDADVYWGEMYGGSSGVVLRVSATPLDSTQEVTYSIFKIPDNIKDLVEIDPSTGDISTKNLGEVGEHQFTVMATIDTGNDTAEVTLNVISSGIDVNGWPGYLNPIESVSFSENKNGIVPVVSIVPDINGNKVMYEIKRVLPEVLTEYFKLNSVNGELSVEKPLDRESNYFVNDSVVQVQIRAYLETEETREETWDKKNIIVSILDENDEKPTFSDPSEKYVGYPEPEIAGFFPTAVMTAQAFDKDSDASNRMTHYTVNDTAKFYVDLKSGVVYPNGDTPPECYSGCRFTVTAFDANKSDLQSNLQIVVMSLKEDQIFAMDIKNMELSDLDALVQELSTKTELNVGVVHAYQMTPQTRRLKASTGTVRVYLYALDKNNEPVDYNTFSSTVDGIEVGQGTIGDIKPLTSVMPPPTTGGGGESSETDAGLLTAVIILSVILGLLVLVIASFGYVKIAKRKGLDWKKPWKKTSPYYSAKSLDTESNGSANRTVEDGPESVKVTQNYDSVRNAFNEDRLSVNEEITETKPVEFRNTAAEFIEVQLTDIEEERETNKTHKSSHENKAFEPEVKTPDVAIPEKDYSPQSSPKLEKKPQTEAASENHVYEELPSTKDPEEPSRKKSTVTFSDVTEIIADDTKKDYSERL